MSHVWLVSMVHTHDREERDGGYVYADVGEITAFSEPGDMRLRGLTHWRPAVPEEWKLKPLPTHREGPRGQPGTLSSGEVYGVVPVLQPVPEWELAERCFYRFATDAEEPGEILLRVRRHLKNLSAAGLIERTEGGYRRRT